MNYNYYKDIVEFQSLIGGLPRYKRKDIFKMPMDKFNLTITGSSVNLRYNYLFIALFNIKDRNKVDINDKDLLEFIYTISKHEYKKLLIMEVVSAI